MRGLVTAIGWLTILPIPGAAKQDHHKALIWSPAVGLLIGLFIWAAAALGTSVDLWLGALFGMLMWFVITGFLHADALADLSDALGAAHGDKSRFIEVLKDPHVGSFGVMALILLVVAKLVLLNVLLAQETWWILILIPAWGRLGALYWAVYLPSLTDGIAKSWSENISSKQALWWVAALVLITMFVASSIWLVFVMLGLLWLWYYFLKHKVGGANGDCLGAGIEVCEAGMLFMVVLFHA